MRRSKCSDVIDSDSIVACYLQIRSKLAEILHEVVGEGIVVVDDDARSSLHVSDVILHHDRSDRDVQFSVAVITDPSDRAGVDASATRLKLFDDLHRANLRSASDRAARKASLDRIECALPFCQ